MFSERAWISAFAGMAEGEWWISVRPIDKPEPGAAKG